MLKICSKYAILANCPVFGGTSRFFHSSIELFLRVSRFYLKFPHYVPLF